MARGKLVKRQCNKNRGNANNKLISSNQVLQSKIDCLSSVACDDVIIFKYLMNVFNAYFSALSNGHVIQTSFFLEMGEGDEYIISSARMVFLVFFLTHIYTCNFRKK